MEICCQNLRYAQKLQKRVHDKGLKSSNYVLNGLMRCSRRARHLTSYIAPRKGVFGEGEREVVVG